MNIIDFANNYKYNCFWFFIPIIIFNLIFTKYLPKHYLKNIKHPIVTLETIARIITITFSIIMEINHDNKMGKIGVIAYIIGVLIYFCSYFIVIKLPITSFNNNIAVLLAPYWTSILWLIGIGLIGNKLFVNIPYHYIIYIVISIVFTILHSIHGYICIEKNEVK
ncbi:hypothetical protein [Treponema sp. R80B11-R83G3]